MELDYGAMEAALEKVTRNRMNHWKPAAGRTRVRFLPGWAGARVPFITLLQHNVGSGQDFRTYVCPRTPGIDKEECAFCDMAQYLKRQSNEIQQQMGKDMSARPTNIWNLIVRGKENEGVKQYVTPVSIYTSLLAYVVNKAEWPDFLSITNGFDVEIERIGSGFLTKYALLVSSSVRTPLLKDPRATQELWEKAADLTTFIKAETNVELAKALRRLDLGGDVTTTTVAPASSLSTESAPVEPPPNITPVAPSATPTFASLTSAPAAPKAEIPDAHFKAQSPTTRKSPHELLEEMKRRKTAQHPVAA
jgi:hypothetical protein